MSGGLYLGTVTIAGTPSVTTSLSKETGGISSPLVADEMPVAVATPLVDGNYVNMLKYKSGTFYGTITSQSNDTFLQLVFSTDAITWYPSSQGGILTPGVGVGGAGPVSFSRDFSTAAPFVGLYAPATYTDPITLEVITRAPANDVVCDMHYSLSS